MTDFGRGWLDRWLLDPAVAHLNDGTVGATPIAILEAQRRIVEEIERLPSRFQLRELTEVAPTSGVPRLRAAAGKVAAHLGADGDDLVFVDNATTGISAVLQSFPFAPGDTIVLTSFGYGSVTLAAEHVARRHGLDVVVVEMPFSVTDPGEVLEAFRAGLPAGARLAIVDHVTSDTALVLPIAELVEMCRANSTMVLVDGAHVPGMLPLDIEAIGADLYVANLHKWLWVPRSSGILWAAKEHQSWLRPPVLSWGIEQSFTAAFDHPGTRDPSAHLAAPAAIDLFTSIGAEAIQRWNHDLVFQAGHRLAERWGTELSTPESMVGAMMAVPLPPELGITRATAPELRWRLLDEHAIDCHVGADDHSAWVRIAGQVHNDLDDYLRLGEVVAQLTASQLTASRPRTPSP